MKLENILIWDGERGLGFEIDYILLPNGSVKVVNVDCLTGCDVL
jgi:hypothetical protein